MPNLVIHGKRQLKVGQIYHGLGRGPHYEPRPEQSFRVIAQSTKEEWIKCVVSFGEDKDWAETLTVIGGPWLYYEIQTD